MSVEAALSLIQDVTKQIVFAPNQLIKHCREGERESNAPQQKETLPINPHQLFD